MAPTSAGQYHWVSMLAPSSARKFLGYMTGWLTITGWQATVASAAYLTGTMIQGLILLTHPDYEQPAQNWHGTLLLWGVILLSYTINTAIGMLLATFEGLVFFLHILGFFGVLLSMVLLKSEHASSEDVFNTFFNSGDWQTQGLSFCIGILGIVYAFVGGGSAIHMSEEIHNAATVVPWSILTGLLLNGTLGFAMMIATLYCMGDVEAAIAENPHYPFMAIFHNAVGSTAGAAVMSSIVLVMTFSATTGCLASTSRVYWAFARDRGIPGWRFLKKVSPRTSIPTHSVLTTCVISVILSFVNIGDATAFNGIISISVAGLFGSIGMMPSVLTNTMGSGLSWGPWRIPGLLGVANNILCCSYLLFIFFFSFWPTSREVTPQTMNWAVLVTVVVITWSIVYYLAWARKTYSGPIIEV
ncbi:amino acid transporter [Hypoxylon rubiginosum]|uniref:Amino acid transporter n=1 Tax=Hypoxylon rubiginosum TaxID=110542 RepID=A0ACB9YSD3_9PEZI|nr:amino acid transporter [Hypoxylon rubiginosum]